MGMKKIIRNVLIGICVVVIVAVAGLAARLFINNEPDVRTTVKTPDGKSYVVKEEEGTKYAVVKDENGKLWGAEINDDGSIGETKADLSGKASDSDVINNYIGPNIDVTNNVDYTGQAVEIPTTKSQTQSTLPQGNNTPTANNTTTTAAVDETPRIKKYIDIFASNNYLMEFTTSDEKLSKPIVAAAKNGNILIDTVMPYDENTDIACKLLYLADKDKTYFVIDNIRKYISIPEDALGDDFNLDEMNMGSSLAEGVDLSKIKQSTVMIDGKEFHCESSKSKHSEVKYYFDGDTLFRIDKIDDDGTVTTTNFKRITSDVPDSTFEIPSNYGYWNLSWIDFLSGSKDKTTK